MSRFFTRSVTGIVLGLVIWCGWGVRQHEQALVGFLVFGLLGLGLLYNQYVWEKNDQEETPQEEKEPPS